MITLRCSGLDLFRECRGSIGSDGILADARTGAADMGTAFHEGIPLVCCGSWPDVEALARKHQVDADELGMLLALGRKAWDGLGQWFPEPEFERELRYEAAGVLLTGHADLLASVATAPDAVLDDEIRCLDWKSGREDASHEQQLRGYAWLALNSALPMALHNTVRVCTVRVREQTAEWASYSRAELEDWWAALVARTREPERFNPGRHCGFCPRALTCEARTQSLRQGWDALACADDYAVLPGGYDIGHLYQCVQAGQHLLDKARELIKAEVQRCGGAVPIRGGPYELAIEQTERRTVNVAAGWGILLNTLKRNGLLPLLSIAKGELEKAVRQAAGRGQGKAALEAMYQALEQAGAVETTYQERLDVRRSAQPVPALENKP